MNQERVRRLECRQLLAVLGAALALSVLVGCVGVPQSGPVQNETVVNPADPDDAAYFDPPGPTQDATPVDIVQGFLLAMQANPLKTATAREFLTVEAGAGWVPENGTVIYGSRNFVATDNQVTVRFSETAQLDRRGRWLGEATQGMRSHELLLVQEKGEWRISNPPDALLVPESHFESYFRPYSLYFFDRAGEILVPEPVYLRRGEQTPTLLLRGLLLGPGRDLQEVVRSFIPPSTEIDLSVLVGRDGTAEVPLSDEILDLSEQDLRLLSAQVVWTLRQVGGVRSVRLTVDGSPLDVAGIGTEQPIQSWAEFDPEVNWASEELFGLREGRVVAYEGKEERRVAGPFGSEEAGLRTIAVDFAAEQVVGVSEDGGSLLLAPRGPAGDGQPEDAEPQLVLSGGTDLLPPEWDLAGQVWAVDRTSQGAEVSVVRSGVATPLDVPGVTGTAVKAFVLSRDGTRLVAVVAGEDRDRVMVSRIVRGDDGRAQRSTLAVEITLGEVEVSQILDLAWRTPTSLAVLAGPTGGVSQVVIVRIDGSSATGDIASNAEVFAGKAAGIASSPAGGTPLYVRASDGYLFELAASGRWTGASIKRGLVSPTFVG